MNLNVETPVMQVQRIGMIGYGEVGKTFCAGLRPQVASVHAWDLKFNNTDTSAG